MKDNTFPVIIKALTFLLIGMLCFLIYKSLSENIDNESIEKHEKITLEHVYETEVLTADAVPLTCRVHYTYFDNNYSLKDIVNCCESIIKYSFRSTFLNCYIVDVLSKQNIIKEKIEYKCHEESTKYSFELKIHNVEFIL